MRLLPFTALALLALGGAASSGCKKHAPAGPRPKLELAEVPVIQSAIPGGRISITLGSTLGATPDEARRLAAAFGGPP